MSFILPSKMLITTTAWHIDSFTYHYYHAYQSLTHSYYLLQDYMHSYASVSAALTTLSHLFQACLRLGTHTWEVCGENYGWNIEEARPEITTFKSLTAKARWALSHRTIFLQLLDWRICTSCLFCWSFPFAVSLLHI